MIRTLKLRDSEIAKGQWVKRALPNRGQRTIGHWCFLDHMGPLKVTDGKGGINVAPHPHIACKRLPVLEGALSTGTALQFQHDFAHE